jgi:hypothetical protein
VGEKTYGKGSVQRVFTVPEDIAALVGGRASLRLTVQYYHLPSGRCIHTRRSTEGAVLHEGGITPDVVVEPHSIPLWKAHEFEKIAETDIFQEYTRDLVDDDSPERRVCRKLLEEGDGGDPFRYPGFRSFYEKIKGITKLEPEDLRLVFRAELRRAYEDYQGAELPCDFQDDPQVQRAILEVLKQLSLDPRSFAEYASFAPAAKEGEEVSGAPEKEGVKPPE